MSPSTPAPPTRLLPVAQAAEQVSTTAATLYELVASHAIPSDRIGRAIIPDAALIGSRTSPPSISHNLIAPGIDEASARRSNARPPTLSRCLTAATANSRRANPASRTPVGPESPTPTCTPARPVYASTQRARGRDGHEPA
jgi:hypothetical protein